MKWKRDAIIIGWNEYVDLPDWGIRGIRAKVDTGARSSALHVENIEELGRDRVRFDVVVGRHKPYRRAHVVAHVSRRGRVRSSTGHYTVRPFVETTVRLGDAERKVELSLVDREKMIFRMLLGRTALSGPFLIDVNHSKVLGRRRKKAAGKKKKKKVKKKVGGED